jgi:hypothetical protein
LILAAGGLEAQAYLPSIERHDSRILGVLPNYRTIPDKFQNVKPMSGGEKFRLATAQSFDRSSFFVAGLYAGMSQAGNLDPSWGQGAKGFTRRYGAAYADQAIGSYLTAAVFPILFHEDPRYFRTGHGTFFRRMSYAVDRIAVTRTDKGSNQVNYSEFLGTAVAAGISNAYYPANTRTVGNTVQMFGYQLATGALFNVLQEFWPDIQRKLSHKSAGRAGGPDSKLSKTGFER